MKILQFLFVLTACAAGQASAINTLYCVPNPAPNTFHLDKISTIHTVARSSYMSSKTVSTYAAGTLRTQVTDTTAEGLLSKFSKDSRSTVTYSYTPQGKLSSAAYSYHTPPGKPDLSQETYEYDGQGRLTRVTRNEGPGTPSIPLVTCTYAASTVFEKVAVKEGMRAYDIEYTLNAQGKVARYSYTLAPQGSRKEIPEVTTITYANGKVARAEARREDSSGISITVTDYNAAGLAVRELQTIYDQQMKVISLSGYVYEYVMDASGNWVEQREYEEEGKTRTLNASDTRVIAYLNK